MSPRIKETFKQTLHNIHKECKFLSIGKFTI